MPDALWKGQVGSVDPVLNSARFLGHLSAGHEEDKGPNRGLLGGSI